MQNMQMFISLPLVILFVTGLVIIVFLYFYDKRSKQPQAPKQEPTFTDSSTNLEMVTCPFCGHKNKQEITKCANCDGDI